MNTRVSLGMVVICLVAVGCKSSINHSRTTTVVIDGASKGPVFDGVGALSAGASSRLLIDYPEPQRSQILDYLFKPGYGAALQHLKVEIGADVNSTDGSEPSYARTPTDRDFTRGYEWWLMSEARKRNPKIVLDTLPWGAPGWVGKFYSKNTAKYIAGFLQGAKQHYGLGIVYTGIWNERPYNPDYVKLLRQVLDQDGLKSTKIVCCDDYSDDQWKVIGDMQHDQALRDAVAVVGVHSLRHKGVASTPADALNSGKPLWSSEDKPDPRHTPRDWATGGRSLAQIYNYNYLKGGVTATEIWSPITSYYDNLAAANSGLMYANTPWSGNYRVQGAIWATAHTTQFTQPGWQYLASSSGYLVEKGDYVALKSPNGGDWSIVLQTIDAKNPQDVRFEIKGGLKTGTIHVWETNNTKIFQHVADVPVVNGSFSYSFDPDSLYSLTTTTGQGKGEAVPPPPAPFPFPWNENFENVRLHGTPPYLSDQDGAFEASPCVQRKGRCLEQVITQKPISWGRIMPDPWTLAGNDGWKDYTVASDANLMRQGSAVLLGRIDSANVFADHGALYPSSYLLRITYDGTWSLLSAEYKKPTRTLAHGSLSTSSTSWHRMELRFQGTTISASVDGNKVASVSDSAHTHGMIGIGTGWTRTQFDNLSIEKP